jgi:uncharacterized protein (TIGR03492 family)
MDYSSHFSLTPRLRLLCLSNGHGEDIIAVRIVQELQQLYPNIDIAALPIVGEGKAYTQLGVPLIGQVKTMPSGGFLYMDGRQLLGDIQGGLLQLSWHQLRAIRQWVKACQLPINHQPSSKPDAPTPHSLVLAVGDIVPLLFSFWSGANYAFVGTAKSEYYVRDENGVLPGRSPVARLEHWSGSIYHPWERYFMSHRRCQAVFPRDSLTTKILQQCDVPAFDLGNPMMDRLEPTQSVLGETSSGLKILLLPGSRPPEAHRNWELILQAVADLTVTFSDCPLLFLGAIAPHLDLEPFCQSLVKAGFSKVSLSKGGWGDLPDALTFQQKNGSTILTQYAYNDCLHQAQIAIAMAGTATEQFIGLGKPAIIIPGQGPQFTYAFAEAQSRHFGKSIILVQSPQQVAEAIAPLLSDPERRRSIAENGIRRMGKPGAARRIAECLGAL